MKLASDLFNRRLLFSRFTSKDERHKRMRKARKASRERPAELSILTHKACVLKPTSNGQLYCSADPSEAPLRGYPLFGQHWVWIEPVQ